jgi:hypothetical protein
MKLTYLTVDQVRTIIGLAERAQTAQDRLLDRANKVDIVASSEGISPDDQRETLSAAADALRETDLAGPIQVLDLAISRLAPEARRELLAIALIGRGDHAARQWDNALTEAESLSDDLQVRVLADMESLTGNLSKGLYQLRLV